MPFFLDPHLDIFLAAERIILDNLPVLDLGTQVGPEGHGVDRTAADPKRDPAPDEDHQRHDGRGDHDLQRLVAGLVDADDVLAEEVERDGYGDGDRPPAGEQVLCAFGSQEVDVDAMRTRSTNSPMMYCPAETALIGPVRM